MMQNDKKVKQKRNIIKRKQKTAISYAFDEETLKAEILAEAVKLRVAETVAKTIADKVAKSVAIWVAKRAAVTLDDVNRRVGMEMAKYNADLAYVYQNRGKII